MTPHQPPWKGERGTEIAPVQSCWLKVTQQLAGGTLGPTPLCLQAPCCTSWRQQPCWATEDPLATCPLLASVRKPPGHLVHPTLEKIEMSQEPARTALSSCPFCSSGTPWLRKAVAHVAPLPWPDK